ncbi:MAG: right-handed parallel beta-helix repeat-containing protein [Nitrospirota bacterium]|nr:MAG: right-handed parallel beta-helix repeat-containing protein [Nitrospirota bacterium]
MAAPRRFLSLGFILSVTFFLLLIATPSWAGVECGDEIGPYEVAVLTEDLTCDSHDPALTVVGPKAVLKMGGHTVTCQGINVGILLDGSGAKLSGGLLKYGTVTNCDIGVDVGGTGGHLITKVKANEVTVGFLLRDGSDGNTFTKNTVTNHVRGGFVTDLGTSNDNEFSYNRSMNGFPGAGYEVRGGDRNVFKYNLAKNNGNRGGFIVSGNDNVLTKNQAIDNGGGIRIDGERNTVSGNVAKGNDMNGFSLLGSGNKVIGNWAKNNTRGIVLSAENTKVIGNIALGNTEFDLVDENENCDNNTWKFNWFKTSQTNPPDAGCIH